MPNRVIAACDGACSGNPGPAAWAWVLADADGTVRRWESGALGRATNNVGELTALERLLAAVDPADDLEVRMDSQYAMNAVTTWIKAWKRNGWQTAAKKPVANRELVISIDTLLSARARKPKFVYTPAHQAEGGDPLNDLADRAARSACQSQRGAAGTRAEEVPEMPALPPKQRSAKSTGGGPAARSTRTGGAAPGGDTGAARPGPQSRTIKARFAGRCYCGTAYAAGADICKGASGQWGHQACATA